MYVAVIDYGLGNVQSVIGAIEKLGFDAVLTNDHERLTQSDILILPGVGAFGDGMKHLEKNNLIDILNKLVLVDKKPILGICLGMHLFATKGYEFGEYKGLGWIEASVQKFEIPVEFKLPHVGWNDISILRDSELFSKIEEKLFYFVHSYHFVPKNEKVILATCNYGIPFVASVNQANIYGTQFHPEKSQKEGLLVLKNFLKKYDNA